MNPTPDIQSAQIALQQFLSLHGHGQDSTQPLLAIHDVDADGVTAGVVWQRACQRLNFTSPQRLLPGRERNAWAPHIKEHIAQLNPRGLFVMDLGSQPTPILEDLATCYIDHHRPGGVLKNDTLISAYNWNPIPCTSLLVYELFMPLVDISDLDWIAAIGAISDLGEKAPFEIVSISKKKYTAKYLKEATTLVNAIRRSSQPDPEIAAQALLSHTSPREMVNSDSSEVAQLRAAREEVKAALEEAKKVAPVFAEKVALLRVHSRCQVHPLIAQIWRTRLPGYIVIAANDLYVENRVNFSARAPQGINILEFLRAIKISPGEGDYGHGHDAASGGSLPPERWNEFVQKLGFQ